jgi:glycosyltransferase involved in cell wall biosynthesis
MNEKIIAVIPAFNEEKTIGKVIDSAKKYVDGVIVVDDASKDKTYNIATEKSAIVVKHDKNLGYENSINDGFKEAEKHKPSIILVIDADGQHLPEDIPKIIKPIKEKTADVVVGIRPYRQRFSEKIYAIYAKKKIGILDPLCGFKAISFEAYKKIGFFDSFPSIATEILFVAKKMGFRINQVKIDLNRREDEPRFGNVIKSNYRILKVIIKIHIKYR